MQIQYIEKDNRGYKIGKYPFGAILWEITDNVTFQEGDHHYNLPVKRQIFNYYELNSIQGIIDIDLDEYFITDQYYQKAYFNDSISLVNQTFDHKNKTNHINSILVLRLVKDLKGQAVYILEKVFQFDIFKKIAIDFDYTNQTRLTKIKKHEVFSDIDLKALIQGVDLPLRTKLLEEISEELPNQISKRVFPIELSHILTNAYVHQAIKMYDPFQQKLIKNQAIIKELI